MAYNADKYGRSEADEWLWFVQAMIDDWEDPLQHPNLLAKIADQHYGDGTEIVIRFQSQRIDSTPLPGIELSLTKQGRPQPLVIYEAHILARVFARMIEAAWVRLYMSGRLVEYPR